MAKLLITAQQVIDLALTGISDPALIKDTFIDIAQEKHLRPVLGHELEEGDSLYDELLVQIDDGTIKDNPKNELLIRKYIIPTLAFFVKHEVIVDMNIQTGKQGLFVNNSEFATGASSSQRAELSEKSLDHAKALCRKMVRFIETNDTDYPTYDFGLNVKNNSDTLGGIIF